LGENNTQKDTFLDSKEEDLKSLEISLMERIGEESNMRREIEKTINIAISNTMSEIKGEINRDIEDRKITMAELRNILEVNC